MRPDIIPRVFKQKFEQLIMKDQVREACHMHLFQILDKKDKVVSAEQMNDFISAEIPDHHEDPVLYELTLSSVL
uniref:Uncharacterized protein n=1 Tax=Acrobeloides nanus TaxID=290746 RepID=A0A914CJM7_9BILA